MLLLDFPVELVDHILYFSVLSRNIPRAFRLKLVCKPFYAAFNRVLFHTGLLDRLASDSLFKNWHTRKYHGADKLWHEYLLFNCRNLPDASVRRFVEIRDVAGALLRHCETREEERHRDLNFDAILDRLCWLGLYGSTKSSRTARRNSQGRWLVPPPDLALNLLSAATYFECEVLVRNLLGQGHDPSAHNDLFPSPLCVAAWTGQPKLLEFMQDRLPEFEDIEPARIYGDFRSKIGPGSLEGAAIRGDMAMTPTMLGAAGGAGTGEIAPALVLGERRGSVAQDSKMGFYIMQGMRLARSPEVYQYLQRFLDQDLSQEIKNWHLVTKAAAGDVVMVRHLIENGADHSPEAAGMTGPPLMAAAREWHEDVVDVLLELGADPNERGGYQWGTLLSCAARAGSMRLLRKLLNAGVKIDNSQDGFTLRFAYKMEHTAMVKMLLGMAILSEGARRAKLEDARDAGLESMVELLEPWVLGREPVKPKQSLLCYIKLCKRKCKG